MAASTGQSSSLIITSWSKVRTTSRRRRAWLPAPAACRVWLSLSHRSTGWRKLMRDSSRCWRGLDLAVLVGRYTVALLSGSKVSTTFLKCRQTPTWSANHQSRGSSTSRKMTTGWRTWRFWSALRSRKTVKIKSRTFQALKECNSACKLQSCSN